MKWKGTITIGAVGSQLNSAHLPSTAISLRRLCWIFTHDYININGCKMQSRIAECLLKIQKDTVLTLSLSHTGTLSLQMGDRLIEDIATGLPHHIYPLIDLYGKCEKISLINSEATLRNGTPINEEIDSVQQIGTNGASSSLTLNGCGGVDGTRNSGQCEKADLEIHEKETDTSLPAICCDEPNTSGEQEM